METNRNINTKTGAELIAEERERHYTEEAFEDWQDDEHVNFELGRGAEAYLFVATTQEWMLADPKHRQSIYLNALKDWKWDADDFKPSEDRIRNLVKAGAMICAEIDRLQRLKTEAV